MLSACFLHLSAFSIAIFKLLCSIWLAVVFICVVKNFWGHPVYQEWGRDGKLVGNWGVGDQVTPSATEW